MHRILMFVTGLVIAFNLVIAGEQPVAEALKVIVSPVLDGKLDEPFWKDAQPLTDFYIHKDPDKRRVNDTEVRLAYDDAWLYLGIKCDNPLQKLILNPKTREHDGPVSADEAVELFFSSDGVGKVYYHFMLSCFNVKAEQRIINGSRERQTWNQPWRSATVITEDGWTAEAAIPLYLFLEYGDLEHLRLNITRARRLPFMDGNNVITHETMEHSSWQPVARSFHEPAAFGELAELTPGKIRIPFLVGIERVDIQPYFTDNGTNYYQVDVVLKGANAAVGAVEAVIVDQPVSGEKSVLRKRVDMKGVKPIELAIAVPVSASAERSITVEARDAGSGELWQKVIVEKPAVLKVMSGWLDRNYYTSEEKCVAVATIGMPESALKDLVVTVEMGGKTLASAPAARETAVEFEIDGLEAGTYPVRIALLRHGGAPFAAVETELIKRAPKPGHEWKIDQINRVVLRPDGSPFFPIGIIMSGVKPEDNAAFKDIAEAGCNTFFQWYKKDLSATDTIKYPEQAQKHGLYVISQMETGWQLPKDSELTVPQKFLNEKELVALMKIRRGGSLGVRAFLMHAAASRHPAPVKTDIFREYVDKNLPLTEQAVSSVMHAENLLAYSSFDEPFDSRQFDMTQSLAAIYRQTHQTDGYHPVKVLYSSHIPEGAEYVTCCDILCTDPYWIPAGPTGRDTPNFVSKIVHWNNMRAAEFRKAVWIVPQAGYWSGCRKRGLTDAEQDCQNFLAIIHGARGLFWFCYTTMQAPSAARLKPTIDKVRIIGAMALQPAVDQTVKYLTASAPGMEYQEVFFAPEREAYPDVQGRIFRDPTDGGLVLVVANSRYYPVTATFTVAGLTASAQRVFTDASLPVSAGAFSEELEPFAVRAYHLGRGLTEPVELTTASLRPEKIPPTETAWLGSARMEHKNKFPNPSFEDVTVPGNPDYFYNSHNWTLDDTGTAKFGRNCLKITKRTAVAPPWTWLTWPCDPQHDQPTSYTWSFWAKGGQGGEKLWARHAPSGAATNIVATVDWQRYSIEGVVIPARHRGSSGDFGILLKTVGNVWVDGLQLELGNQTTEFED